jgi:hypothetical protein
MTVWANLQFVSSGANPVVGDEVFYRLGKHPLATGTWGTGKPKNYLQNSSPRISEAPNEWATTAGRSKAIRKHAPDAHFSRRKTGVE